MPATAENVIALMRSVGRKATERWGGNADVIEFARHRLEVLKRAAPSPLQDLEAYNVLFAERATEGWYVESIVIEATTAERAVAEQRPWEAVACAMRIGELLTELRMKQLWEPHALRGKKIYDSAPASRRRSREDRVADVDSLIASGSRITKAFAAVAAAERCSPKTIERDYYLSKKKTS